MVNWEMLRQRRNRSLENGNREEINSNPKTYLAKRNLWNKVDTWKIYWSQTTESPVLLSFEMTGDSDGSYHISLCPSSLSFSFLDSTLGSLPPPSLPQALAAAFALPTPPHSGTEDQRGWWQYLAREMESQRLEQRIKSLLARHSVASETIFANV